MCPRCVPIGRQEASKYQELRSLSREIADDMPGKEYGTLELLLLRQGKAVRKEAFLSHLYGGLTEPGVRIIDVFVCHLRKKLVDAGLPNLITTVTGYGYLVRPSRPEPVGRAGGAEQVLAALDEVVPAA